MLHCVENCTMEFLRITGAVWVRQNNGDIAFVPDPAGGPEPVAVGFSANGVELYSRLKFGKFAAIFGFDDYIPRDLSPLINSNFKTRYAILGAEWHFSKSGYAFVETRLGTPWMRRERMYPTPRPSASVTTLAGKPHIPSKLRVQAGVREAAVVFRETVRSDACVYQSRKSLPLCSAGLRVRWFDPIAEASELPDHSCSALLL